MRWQFVADNAGVESELVAARNRKVTWRLDAPADASFGINGRGALAAVVHELSTDLLVTLDGVRVYRGRVGSSSDKIDADKHDVEFQTADYRALLGRRILYDTDVLKYGAPAGLASVDQFQIAWRLIQQTQARTGGNLGIVEATVGDLSGVVRDRQYEAGKPIGDAAGSGAIVELGRVINGFEWEIDADKKLRRWHPTRGSDLGVVLDYGGLITNIERVVNPGTFFDGLRMTGVDTLTPEIRTSADIATRPEGRWDMQIGEPDVLLQATLAQRADFEIEDGPLVLPSYVVTFAPGRWEGVDHVWVGDTVGVRVRSLPRLDVDAQMRVYDVAVAINDSGQASVTMSLNAPRPDYNLRLPALSRRLENLERR